MIVSIIIFIVFLLMIGYISYYYIKKLWYIVKTIKYLKLQKMMMGQKLLKTQEESVQGPKPLDVNDPMFA